MESQSQSCTKFDPSDNYHNTYEAFCEFVGSFEYTYEALNRIHPTNETNVAAWTELDKRRVFLGRYCTRDFQKDFESEVPLNDRSKITFTELVNKMKARYAKVRNHILANYEFHRITQEENETIESFAKRLSSQSLSCQFKCNNPNCNVPDIMIRDQIIFGTNCSEIRQQALKTQWNLRELIKNARILETAMRSSHHIEADSTDPSVSRIRPGKYSKVKRRRNKVSAETNKTCITCSNKLCEGGRKCLAFNKSCFDCGITGHFKGSKACAKSKVKSHQAKLTSSDQTSTSSSDSDSETSSASINNIIVDRSSSANIRQIGKNLKYRVNVTLGNQTLKGFADTGADINVMSVYTARSLSIPLTQSKLKIRPYGSRPIRTAGYYKGPVTFNSKTILAKFYIIPQHVQPLLSGKLCEALGIISFHQAIQKHSHPPRHLNLKSTGQADIMTYYPSTFQERDSSKKHTEMLVHPQYSDRQSVQDNHHFIHHHSATSSQYYQVIAPASNILAPIVAKALPYPNYVHPCQASFSHGIPQSLPLTKHQSPFKIYNHM